MEVTVRSAKKSQAAVLDNLMQLYLHDFSEFSGEVINESGRYEYPYLDHYWEDPDRYPFLIYADKDIAGFALTRFEVDPLNGQGRMDMTEFFVLRPYRRQQIGTLAAERLWNLFPGQWQVMVWKANKPAYAFWKPLIEKYTEKKFDERDEGSRLGGEYRFMFHSNSEFDPPPDLEIDMVE